MENGECKMQNAEFKRACVDCRLLCREQLVDDDGPYGRESVPAMLQSGLSRDNAAALYLIVGGSEYPGSEM
jgi:hypothetical protein